MKVVIIGAGDIGSAIAQELSTDHHDVILVDLKRSALERAIQELDIATRLGSGTDWQLLEELKELGPDLLIAATENDETNFVCSAIAKGLAYPRTIARVRQWKYLSQTRIDCGRLFSVDHLISPELLVVQDICKDILNLGSIRVENFALGAVQMRTLIVPPKWKYVGIPLSKLTLPEGVMVGLIARSQLKGKGKPLDPHQMIFPHGNDSFHEGDEVTFIGQTEAMGTLHRFFGIEQKGASSVVIFGGDLVAFHTARTLAAKGISVRLIEPDRQRCTDLAERLSGVTIIHHDPADLNFLLEEKISRADVAVACTTTDERNVHTALLAKEAGCQQVIAVVSEPKIGPMLRELGITHLVSARTSAANSIMAIATSRSVIASRSLYQNRAKVLELKISIDSPAVGIPLSDLGPYLPKDSLIAAIQNRGRTLIADGRRILCPGDSAIVICSPKHVDEMLQIF
ncbi:MAG: Trk system potassium transporter TrkA [Verrucomicrobia bacterium]|nr:Trk system potassium transporter TrkA [Verrucomicrobiota bacterium]